MFPRRSLLSGIALSILLAAAAVSTPGASQQEPTRPADLFVADGPVDRTPQPDAIPDHWFGPGPLHKVWIKKDEAPALGRIQARGSLVRAIDYGGFRLAIVDERTYGGAAALRSEGFDFRDEQNLMLFNGIVLDGLRPQVTLDRLDASERFGEPGAPGLATGAGLYIVQFEGPVRDEWLNEVRAISTGFTQFVPMNAYVVRVADERVAALEALADGREFIQYVGAYEPAFKMHPALRRMVREGNTNTPQRVTIQLVNDRGVRSVLEEIKTTAAKVVGVHAVGPYINAQVELHPVFLQTFAASRSVFQIEPLGERARTDERQGQIMAANTNATGPSAPGYLSWLAGKGFNSSQFGSFSVNVVDDATSLTGHPDLASGRIDFALNPSSQTGSQGGHGFLNAHIVAGLNSGTGSAFEDTGGYNYGLGIAPWAHVGSTAIFGGSGTSATSFESQAYGNGARITTNSWSYQIGGNPIPDYDSNSQEYDFLARDVQNGTSGNQEYLVIFSAGNDGPGGNSVSTPSTGKNMITVGASENNRQTGTDGCAVSNSGANNYNDLASFSSQGPVNSSGGDGRWKPEIVAPGTHIQAGVPQSNYNGSSVCNAYWPSGQTLYGWSSGTSHSTPAVAGGAALVYQDFLNNSLAAPTPAMMKAYLVNSAEYMTGSLANDTLPSDTQGMGNANLERAFDGVARILVDQTELLSATGQSHVVAGNVSDPGQPFRVTLVWTDAPGPTSGAPYVNDLDLTVSVGGQTYLGNVFSGQYSTTGGSSDFRNNTESVFLPAGASGAFTVTVDASSIGGDGVPGNGDSTDQDFALVLYNGTSGPVGPTAAFTGSPTSGNTPLLVNFADNSSGSPTAWAWDFGDGATSTAQNPSHTYASAGSYTVSLDITAPGGNDNETKVGYITVTDPPPPGISDGSFESQTASAPPATPWAIDFGTSHLVDPSGGTTSDGGLPTDGVNWLELSGAGTNNSQPPSNPGGAGTPPSGGAGISQSFSYAAGSTVLEFDAAFLRNESANSTYNDWMSVDVTDGSTWYNVYHADTFTPTVTTSTRHGFPMTAVSNVNVDLATIFPSSTTSTVFTITAQTGNLVDSVQPSVGYADNFRLTGSGPPAPVANFTGSPTSGIVPLAVSFSDSSTGDVTSWSWNFGDGGTSTAQNPNHTYTSTGSYTVTLTVTGPGGSDNLVRTNYITVNEPAPVADFTGTPTSGTAPLAVTFSDASTGPITSWSWNFGDGGTSTAQNPGHTYTTAGTYTVTLTVTGPGGSDNLVRTNYVTVNDAPPVAGFSGSPTSGFAPLAVSFSDSSTGSITSWSWNFGDGGTSTLQNPGHVYTSAGTYTVTLTVTGPGGSDSLVRTNYITVSDPPPTADFTGSPTSGVVPLAVNFSDASSGPITSWSWNFGDGGTSTAQNPSHTYTAVGTYTVTLTVTGPGGSDNLVRTDYIDVQDPTPVANFTGSPTSGTAPLAVSFSDASTGTITGWSWDFGDGGTSTLQNPGHTYTAAGTYTVTLTVTGPGGSDDLVRTNYVTVNEPAPVADFSGSPTSGTVPLAVSFSDASTGAISSWSWDFGDGGTSTLQNPSHTYTSAGSYTVTLTVTGPGGSDNLVRTNYISVSDLPPVASFSATPTSGTAPLLVNFTDLSSGAITSWSWDFGDGGSSTAQNPGHTYTAAGTYTVALTVTGPGGSSNDTQTNLITVTGGGSDPVYYMSFLTTTNVPGVGSVPDEDIVAYDTGSGTWSHVFDGSDVGLNGTDINAFHVRADNSILISVNTGGFSLAGLPDGPNGTTIDDSDIVLFTPSGPLGPNTSGTWSFYLDGSDVALTSNGEDIDGIYEFADGSLGISSQGGFSGTGASGNDEDVMRFTGTFGAATSGSFVRYFDGSDVGFGGVGAHDLGAISFDNDVDLLFSTVGTYSAAGGSGADEDVSRFSGTFGGTTSGSAALVLDGSALGIAGNEDVDGLTYQP